MLADARVHLGVLRRIGLSGREQHVSDGERWERERLAGLGRAEGVRGEEGQQRLLLQHGLLALAERAPQPELA